LSTQPSRIALPLPRLHLSQWKTYPRFSFSFTCLKSFVPLISNFSNLRKMYHAPSTSFSQGVEAQMAPLL